MAISSKWTAFSLLPFLLFSVGLWAQIDKGTVNGTVTDQSGAVIPGVQVSATNVDTGVQYPGVTNSVGIYQIRGLSIGHYSLRFEKSGFKRLDSTGLNLEVGQVVAINVKLEVGSPSEEVTVTSAAPLLENETSSIGTTMDARALADLPLDFGGGRDIFNFVYSNVATTYGSNWSGHIAGSQDMSKNVMVDGTDATAGLQGFVQNIGMEAVQQFQVQVSGVGAEGARTGGGAVLMELKSGTNQLHGSAYYFLENEALNANTWDNNFFLSQCAPGDTECRDTYKRGRDRFSDWGVSAGGPIWKNHTFIFGSWERYKNVTIMFAPNQATVPTEDFLTGNFSALLVGGPVMITDPNNPNQQIPATDPCTGQTILMGQIYDPSAMYVNGSGVTCHVPFPGNIIDPKRISPLTQKIIDNVYKKGYAPSGTGVMNNFPAFAGNAGSITEHFDLKLDHNISKSQRMALSYNWWTLPYTGAGGLWQKGNTSTAGPLSTGLTQTQVDRSIRAQHLFNISPTVLNTFSIVYNEHAASDSPPTPFDAGKLGFEGTNGKNFPNITFNPDVNSGSSVNGFAETSIGPPYSDGYAYYNYSLSDTVSWVKGRHNFKVGGDFQFRGMNNRQDGGIRIYNFSNNTGAPVDGDIAPFVGFAFANFLLGDVQSASQSVGYVLNGRRRFLSLFAADDIKVNAKLTLNASLRWDVNSRFHEKRGQWSSFDLNAENPVWAPFKGAWTWVKNGSDSFEKNQDLHQFGPHFGAAYQLRPTLVLRGAYGIFYSPLALNQWNGVPWARNGGAFGFVGSNTVVNYIQDATAFQWDAGYPGQDTYPARTPTQTDLSAGVPYTWPDSLHLGMTQNWNIGVEYQLSKDAVVSLNYLGNHGSHLHNDGPWPYNYSTQAAYSKLLNSGHVQDWVDSPAAAATAGVPYPYPGFQGYAYAAINPYPQVAAQEQGIMLVNADLAVSSYRALVAEIKTHGAHGLTADLNYTFSRSEGNGSDGGAYTESWGTDWTQDPYQLKNLGDQVSDWNHTHEVKGYIDYDLPFGRGKKWAFDSRLLDSAVGGWTIGVELNYHSGEPLSMVGSSNYYAGWSGVFAVRNPNVSLHNPFKALNLNWNPTVPGAGPDPNSLFFNPSAFSDPAFGSFSPEKHSILDYWHTWAYADEDVSILKKFHFGKDDRFTATLRAQFFDLFNRHHWGAPIEDITSPYFGHVTGVSGFRYGQVGARFEW